MAFYSLQRILKKVLKECNLPAHNVDAYKVFHLWEEIAGEGLANHATPVRIDDRILYVEVDDPVWLTQVRYMKLDILAKIGVRIKKGIFKDIRFFLKNS
jgi:predicted nucleic acid-binding Zn ribbon protein